jgi:platelet-activating factor acetylhydrolase IB subunit alpha
MEFRGHEHVIECAIFAPINSYPYLQELIGDQVGFIETADKDIFG